MSALPDARLLAHQCADAPAADRDWQAPTPQRLRALLMAMDVAAFARHVIAFAYHSLHPTHPEWYDGVTFNAHLANYLRRRRDETASRGPRAVERSRGASNSGGGEEIPACPSSSFPVNDVQPSELHPL